MTRTAPGRQSLSQRVATSLANTHQGGCAGSRHSSIRPDLEGSCGKTECSFLFSACLQEVAVADELRSALMNMTS
jgi:hypothetical protein